MLELFPELLDQLVADRQHDRQAAAASRRLAQASPARRRVAQSLRRAADRLDGSGSTVVASNALPGRGC